MERLTQICRAGRAEGGDYSYENKYVSNDTKYLFGTLPAAL